MTKEELKGRVQEIFIDIFDDENIIIQDSTNADDIDNWDSFNHINLIMAIEKDFKIKFSFEEMASLKDVGTLLNVLQRKI